MKKYLNAVKSLGQGPHVIQKNKDVIIGTYLSSFEERLLDIYILKDKINDQSIKQREALYSLKNDNTIGIKGADQGSGVIVWVKNDYLK